CHDLLLARGQALMARVKLAYLAFVLQAQTIPPERSLHRFKKFLIADWFGQKFHGTCLHGPYGRWNVAISRNKDNRRGDILLRQTALKFETTHSRKSNVENDATRPGRPLSCKKFSR